MQLIANTELSMTSIELVDFINDYRREKSEADGSKFVELAHRNFMAKVPEVLGEGCAIYLADHRNEQNGQTYRIYRFQKREACLMAMSYSYTLQARIYDRWQKLEEQQNATQQHAIPKTLSSALRLAAEQAELIEQQQAALAAAAPKIQFAEAVRNVDGLCTFEEIAKALGVGRNKLIAQLKSAEVLQENRLPYQRYIDRGYFEVVELTPWKDSSGASHPCFGTRITGAGQVWLARRFAPSPSAVRH